MSLVFVAFDYREKRDAARLLTVRLALRGLKQLPQTLNTWLKDERYVACVLSVWIDGDELPPIRLFDVVLRYGQLTSPDSPGEFVQERVLARDDWDTLLQRSGAYLLVEPANEEMTAKTSALYDRDSLKENLYDTEDLALAHPDHHQLLVVTPGLEKTYSQYLEHFMYPNEAQVVIAHGRSHGRRGLPVLFDVVSAIEIEFVGKGFITAAIDELASMHEFAIMATHYPDQPLTKRLLHHTAKLRLKPREA
ncbi:MAG: hypothetical protein KF892_24415 [Rhizobacter sp.]|nr:hypothetical protein [Rhizobacter sp.]